MRSFCASSSAITLLTLAGSAGALPRVGDVQPAASVADADGRLASVQGFHGKPVLILYEDKESSTVNAELKADLASLARGESYRSSVALLPVADVHSYNFWPIRGFVKNAIRDESRKIGATIYCDWDSSFRKAAHLSGGTSSVILVGRDGRVLFAWEGRVPPEQRRHLTHLLRVEVAALRPATVL